ncbi:hypothetical protein DOTSEDRAFT_38353 [Dothistroma septosporum NZE10]|uniref:Uncharacterized protein n=1 Tax=Dothistroma septosporum (strain NZE10 / CBS 128990) TaxID=675120 RepID=M2Y1B6_DOTSN|nr:hypothetical protein DOTSEDRAFT_38353 [Dothistroma septosporum NZE10]
MANNDPRPVAQGAIAALAGNADRVARARVSDTMELARQRKDRYKAKSDDELDAELARLTLERTDVGNSDIADDNVNLTDALAAAEKVKSLGRTLQEQRDRLAPLGAQLEAAKRANTTLNEQWTMKLEEAKSQHETIMGTKEETIAAQKRLIDNLQAHPVAQPAVARAIDPNPELQGMVRELLMMRERNSALIDRYHGEFMRLTAMVHDLGGRPHQGRPPF